MAQNTGDYFKKNIVFPEGNKQFAGDFVLIWMKQRLIWFNLQRYGTRNGLSNIKETFAESSAPKYEHFPRLVSQVHMMAGQNKYKEKVPDVSDPNQNVETICNSKLKLT